MIQTCPHCLTDVLPSADGNCPACQKNVTRPPNHAGTFENVFLSKSQNLPNTCLICGELTNHRKSVKVTKNESSYGDDRPAPAFPLLGGIGIILSALFSFERDSFNVRIPVCKGCRNHKNTLPKSIDFDLQKVKLIAHKNFITDLKKTT